MNKNKEYWSILICCIGLSVFMFLLSFQFSKRDNSISTGFSESPRVIGQFNNCDIVRFVANGDSRPGYVMDCSKDRLSQRPVMSSAE